MRGDSGNNPFYRKPDNPNYLRRSRKHDYSRPARYLVTIHASETVGALSRVCGDVRVASPQPGSPSVELSTAGNCFTHALHAWLSQYHEIEVNHFIIMPDHVHLCVEVRSYLKAGLSRAISNLMGKATRVYNDYLAQLKGKSSLRSNHVDEEASNNHGDEEAFNNHGDVKFFQKGFNDKIAYTPQQWNKQIKYVHDNPRRYLFKKAFPGLYYKTWQLDLGDLKVLAKGNIMLLKQPEILCVRFSRRYSAEEYSAKVESWKSSILNGGAIVSPYIHPKEREMRDWALDNEGMVIRVCENGFSERFAPQGKEFDFMGTSRFLLIAPLSYNTQKEDMSYKKAQWLNSIAERIAATDWTTQQWRIREYIKPMQ